MTFTNRLLEKYCKRMVAIDSVTEEVDVTMRNLGEEVFRDIIIIRALKE